MTINDELEAAADAWQALAEEAAPKEKRVSSEKRRAELREALDKADIVRLAELTKKLSTAVEQILANPINEEAEEECTDAELQAILTEQLDMSEIEDLLKLRYQLRRARVFAHITAAHIANAVSDPDHAPGEVAVPGTAHKFTREGGKTKLKLDETKLLELLPPETTKEVFRSKTVTEIKLDEDALVKQIVKNPDLMDVVRQCILSVGHTPSSFHVRDL